MRYVAAYLLASLGSNESPSAADIKTILESVGVDVDSELLGKVVGQLSGKKIEDVIAQGQAMLASVPTGGVASSGGGGGGASGGDAEDKAEVKEEKKPESEEESDDDMGFGLFD